MLVIGKFLKPYGVKGLIKLKSFFENPNDIKFVKQFFLQNNRKIELNFISKNKEIYVCSVEGFNSKEEAELLTNKDIFIEKKSLPPLNDDQYYFFELIGLRVFINEIMFGSVVSVNNHGAGDYLEIKLKKSKKIILVPENRVHVKKIDKEKKQIHLNPDYYKNEI